MVIVDFCLRSRGVDVAFGRCFDLNRNAVQSCEFFIGAIATCRSLYSKQGLQMKDRVSAKCGMVEKQLRTQMFPLNDEVY